MIIKEMKELKIISSFLRGESCLGLLMSNNILFLGKIHYCKDRIVYIHLHLYIFKHSFLFNIVRKTNTEPLLFLFWQLE